MDDQKYIKITVGVAIAPRLRTIDNHLTEHTRISLCETMTIGI
ncbi:MAG: hypothetical protein ETSY1_12590 [Candidatus Entotheonella factor]|uniref:Uncharacterized protein n=1 Tax=Entotheonella factor TaxID=1429438 RepID=W4LPR4_ENTF1|nr:MAG: hypothetical protein ETSY1_12590 [Candidatus Entotheonella factor]